MLKPMIGLSLCILVVQALCMAGDVTPSTVTAANKRVEGFHIKAFGVQEALRDIAQKQDLAIGVDAVLTERENKVVLDFPGGTVTDLLNMFVAQSPGYRWRQDGGIIHVFRKDAYLSLANVVLSYP